MELLIWIVNSVTGSVFYRFRPKFNAFLRQVQSDGTLESR